MFNRLLEIHHFIAERLELLYVVSLEKVLKRNNIMDCMKKMRKCKGEDSFLNFSKWRLAKFSFKVLQLNLQGQFYDAIKILVWGFSLNFSFFTFCKEIFAVKSERVGCCLTELQPLKVIRAWMLLKNHWGDLQRLPIRMQQVFETLIFISSFTTSDSHAVNNSWRRDTEGEINNISSAHTKIEICIYYIVNVYGKEYWR